MKEQRTRIRIDLVISHVPAKINGNARDVILRAIASAAGSGGVFGEIEEGASVVIEDAEENAEAPT